MGRHAFIVSDSTGMTAETLGNALLSQFDVPFERVFCPYVDTVDKARDIALRIDAAAEADGVRPLIFDTIVTPEIREVITRANGFVIDIYGTFIAMLEQEVGATAIPRVGKTHLRPSEERAQRRIDAVNYTLENDDGQRMNPFDRADLILIGVWRSAKTPTSLYLAMQFGLFVANYPLTPDDIEKGELPKPLVEQKRKLYGLTIAPERLSQIRAERRADSRYASLPQCQMEVREALALYRRYGIPHLDSTNLSVEEIATQVIFNAGIERKM